MLIAMLDTRGLIKYLSPSYGALLGDATTLIGKSFFAEIHPDGRVRARAMLDETVKTGNRVRAEYRLLSRGGPVRFVESQANAIRDAAGVVTQVLVVSLDVTDSKIAEAEGAAVKETHPGNREQEQTGGKDIPRDTGVTRITGGAVLVVEDEPDILGLTKSLLEEYGFPVLTARDGLEAVELYRHNWKHIGLVMADVDLPKQNGVEAFAEMRKINPLAKVVFSSGYLDPEIRAYAMQQGPSGFVEKPCKPMEIVRLVKSVMDS